MGGLSTERGQSQVLGAILIFGLVVASVGLYQTFIVPQENSEIELNHAQQVEKDFNNLEDAIRRAASTKTTTSSSIKLGTRYPARSVIINPGPASGTIRSENLGQIQIEDASFDETDLCDTGGVQTSTLTYSADYNFLDGAGIYAYETGIQAKLSRSDTLISNSQTLIKGNQIFLTPLTGS